MSHTPGPWIVEGKPPNMKVIFAGVQPGMRPSPCLLMDGDQEANARLIAAAPELNAQLAHLVRLLEPMEQDGTLNVPGLATLNGARAALAKAEGK